jgi:hypothetical protein
MVNSNYIVWCGTGQHKCKFSDKRQKFKCYSCDKSPEQGMFFCDENKCRFNVCKACATSSQLKDPKGHHLRMRLKDFKCKFCRLGQYPVLKCVFSNCSKDFSMCMRCASSYYKKARCSNGHPLSKDPDRKRHHCSDCGKVRKGMSTCAFCPVFDLC